jgi:hypothetical protein
MPQSLSNTTPRQALSPWRCAAVLLLCVTTGLAFAGKPKKLKASKPQSAATAAFYDSTGETKPDRDKRLHRECKGRPNSGACLGYAY